MSPVLRDQTGQSGNLPGFFVVTYFKTFLDIRILLIRFFKSQRLARSFLIEGLFISFPFLFWVSLFVLIVSYASALAGMDLLPVTDEYGDKYVFTSRNQGHLGS